MFVVLTGIESPVDDAGGGLDEQAPREKARSMNAAFLPILLLAGYVTFVWWLWREIGAAPARRASTAMQDVVHPRLRQERVLFVCTHNSARSQMAEALLRHMASSHFLVASAGTAPTEVHPLAEKVMAERGLSLRAHWPKSLAEVGTRWDYVITVCDAANEKCPEFEAKTSRLHWSIDDPSREEGRYSEQFAAFRRVREELSDRIRQWLADREERP